MFLASVMVLRYPRKLGVKIFLLTIDVGVRYGLLEMTIGLYVEQCRCCHQCLFVHEPVILANEEK